MNTLVKLKKTSIVYNKSRRILNAQVNIDICTTKYLLSKTQWRRLLGSRFAERKKVVGFSLRMSGGGYSIEFSETKIALS